MGYMCISIDGSDTAFDLNYMVRGCLRAKDWRSAINHLTDAMAEDNGPWNTPGCVNAAMVITEGHGRVKYLKKACDVGEYKILVQKALKAMEAYVKNMEDGYADESYGNYKMHHDRYVELINKLKALLAKE